MKVLYFKIGNVSENELTSVFVFLFNLSLLTSRRVSGDLSFYNLLSSWVLSGIPVLNTVGL